MDRLGLVGLGILALGFFYLRNRNAEHNTRITGEAPLKMENRHTGAFDIKAKVKELHNRLQLTIPFRVIDTIISTESSWNWQAHNPSSSASGLWQMVNATKKFSSNLVRKMFGTKVDWRRYDTDLNIQILMGLALAEYYWKKYRDPYKVFLAWCSPVEANGRKTKYHKYCKEMALIKWKRYKDA